MFSCGRRAWVVGALVVGGVVAGPAFGDVRVSTFSPVTGDDVLLRQARESLSVDLPVGSVGPAVNPAQFADLSDAEALSLARNEFASDLGSALWLPPVLPSGSHIAGYASDSTAIVEGAGGRTLLTSLIPLRSPDEPSGVKAPVSTTLEAGAGGFAPANPLTPVLIPEDLGDGVSLGRVGVSVTPLGVDKADGRRVGSDKVFFANATSDTDVVVAALPDGVETFSQIRSSDSPADQGLRLDLPPGASLQKASDGLGEVIKQDGVVIARISPASAVDANGTNVPVSESVHGDTVSIRVDDSDSGVKYPIMLDPTITVDSRYWDTGTSSSSLAGWEYKTTNVNAFSSSTSGGWGRGLYSLVRAGMINATDAGEWRYTAPGDARIVNFGLGQVGKTAMRTPNSANGYVPICTSQGLRVAGTSGAWEPGSKWQSGTSTGTGPRTVCQGASTSETPVFCASSSCVDTSGSPGNAAINNQWAYGTGTRLRYNNDPYGVSEYDFIGAAYVTIADDKPPTVGVLSHSATLPTGPVNHFTDTVTLGANDTGTGIWHLTLKNRDADGQDTTLADQGYWCDGSRTVPCAANWNTTGTWATTNAFTYNTDNLPEGSNTLTASTSDRTGNPAPISDNSSWIIKVDRTPPSVVLGGSLSNGPDSDPTDPAQTLSIDATDVGPGGAAAGVTSAELFVDGVDNDPSTQRIDVAKCGAGDCQITDAQLDTPNPLDQGGTCSSDPCPLSGSILLDGASLSNGSHDLKLIVSDAAGNESVTRWTQDVNVPSSSILQRSSSGASSDDPILLPDSEDPPTAELAIPPDSGLATAASSRRCGGLLRKGSTRIRTCPARTGGGTVQLKGGWTWWAPVLTNLCQGPRRKPCMYKGHLLVSPRHGGLLGYRLTASSQATASGFAWSYFTTCNDMSGLSPCGQQRALIKSVSNSVLDGVIVAGSCATAVVFGTAESGGTIPVVVCGAGLIKWFKDYGW